jgi:branched-chain amino acid transport system substrate-binding protein
MINGGSNPMGFIGGSGRLRVRTAACAVVGALALAATACGGSDSGGGDGGGGDGSEPIVIGIAGAKTGPLSPYDLQPGNAFLMRLDEINADGGIDGRQVEAKWIDTKSDKTLAASAATQLINEGAVAVLTTCDFDFGSPAAFQAQAKDVPAISLCASSPKNATPSIIGKYGFSMGTGSDTEGVTAAEWIFDEKPWRKAYVLKDTSLEYSKATADYFTARWKELGGEIIGEDTFVGGENVDIAAQASRARNAAANADVIYIGSWNPGGSTAARQLRNAGIDLPLVGNQSSDGLLTKQVAGNISGYYSTPLACIPSYCTQGEGPDQARVDKFFEDYKAKYGDDLSSSYPINGYDLGNVFKKAIETAGTVDPPSKIAEAMQTMGPVEGINSQFQFTKECHRPVGQERIILEWVKGEGKFVTQRGAQEIPDIGDANPCAGAQAAPE